ncbi:MAG TPA: hypothetical protein VFE47_15495 [Tepidisphaeraceae bacterium]|jgi:hypothetical protein|nr:hypothetical protein [Tepidisphaeraceae bacterium]
MSLKKVLFPASVFAGIAVLFLDLGTVLADDKAPDPNVISPATLPATLPASNPAMPEGPISAPSRSRIIDNAIPDINPANVPPRPAPIIELGNPFFGTGKISPGLELPGGAVWSPTFIVFGQFQSVLQGFENPAEESRAAENKPRTEWANRLDLYGNLQLSGSERILIGVRPLDDGEFARPGKARYSGYNFGPEGTEGGVDAINPRITTLFFEGDFGQLFPDLDPFNTKQLDIGFSIGRQPLLYQDGIFINDDVDAVGITRNNFLPPGGANLQVTAVYAWGQVNRGDGINHGDPGLLGLFFNADLGKTTWNLDTAYDIGSGAHGDGAYAALSATQSIGLLNTTFRVLGSKALESHAPTGDSALSAYGNGSSAVGTGVLLFSEVSWTPSYSSDLVYIDGYWGIDRFTSAARGPDRGGALGRVGILFAEQPIGRYGSALSSDPERSVGGVIGYQKFLDAAQRQQLILELGGRASTDNSAANAVAVGARYQHAFGQHVVLQFDAFTALNEGTGMGYGGRAEFRLEF